LIFATVGSQMPFDRLILALDEWAGMQGGAVNVLAQIGSSDLVVSNLKIVSSLSPGEFRESVKNAEIIVAHAGMGSVLTAMEFGKPLVVLPRLGARQETRNDHQVATAKWLAAKPGVYVAMSESELPAAIDRARNQAKATAEISRFASKELIGALKEFIES
jgi:UDP-N-acetylglucosamine transferase subunit ALG13